MAASMVAGELTPSIFPGKPAFFKARANDPPMRPTPAMATVSIRLQCSADGRGDQPALLHHLRELFRPEGLRAVTERVVRVVVDFDQQSVRSRCDRRPGQWENLVA